MYTRSYPERESEIPEGYHGSAVSPHESEPSYIDGTRNPWETEPTVQDEATEASKRTSPISEIFGGIFQNGRFSLHSIGFEEILIIAAAAYMLMSRDGDRECGIMLLVLLFIA